MRRLVTVVCILVLATGPLGATETITYSYDGLGRLVAASHSGSVNNGVASSITYDPADNRTSYAVTGVATAPVLSVADASATRGLPLAFVVTRTGVTGVAVDVAYATADGSAKADTDYTPTSGTLEFAAGETSKSVSVATSASSNVSDQTLSLTLSNPSGGASLARAGATGTIEANASPPASFTIGNAPAVMEGGTLVFPVTKTGTTNASVSVNYATADGTAKAGSDYNGTSGTINDNDVASITPLNPSLRFQQSTTNAIAIAVATLATLNGRPATITTFGVPSGDGGEAIAADGQSVTYTAPVIGFSVPYSIRDSGTGTVTSGTAALSVRGLPGGRPPPGTVCQ
ncbi:hypothetical protein BHUM_01444 [Candidatus Burkholderia humilis]|nr:hypothetical protein BHUM_01444 [Candidatus Burkholderia humilis]